MTRTALILVAALALTGCTGVAANVALNVAGPVLIEPAIQLVALTAQAASEGEEFVALLFALSVILYWAYRLIKNERKIAKIDAKPDQLLKWNELLEKGAITQEEYDKAKRDLLG